MCLKRSPENNAELACQHCKSKQLIKKGFQRNGSQKYYCKCCGKYQLKNYKKKAYRTTLNQDLISLLKEGCGTRSISRLLNISTQTVTKRILDIGAGIVRPSISYERTHQMDELVTYVRQKNNRICLAYAIDSVTKEVVDFSVGRRNKRTLSKVVDTLLLSRSKEINTDKLNMYLSLIPKEIHKVKQRGINYIERKNLTIRTHVKRLNRRTIAYSKNQLVLVAILKIYFWS